jgi:NlpC/P60 family putative phage cell wall peptidase
MSDGSATTSPPPPTRAEIVRRARAWLGTPYHHQASRLGAGCDCVGLVRGLYREIVGEETEPVPGYSRDWAEASGAETLIEAAGRHLLPVAPTAARPGDVLVFRYRPNTIAKHTGVLADFPDGAPSLIHALEGRGVVEVPLGGWWRRRNAAAFSFPGIID